MRAKFNLTDQEIVRRREEGATIIKLAEESGVSYGTMCRKLEYLQNSKGESGGIQLYDTLGDGKGGFWTVVEITDKQFVIKNRETGRTEMISKQLINSGKTTYHKLDTPPVKVYNLNDTKEPEKKATPVEEIKEPVETSVKPFLAQPPKPTRRRYIEQIEKLLDAAQPEQQSEVKYLYYLVLEIFRNGFDAEFAEPYEDGE